MGKLTCVRQFREHVGEVWALCSLERDLATGTVAGELAAGRRYNVNMASLDGLPSAVRDLVGVGPGGEGGAAVVSGVGGGRAGAATSTAGRSRRFFAPAGGGAPPAGGGAAGAGSAKKPGGSNPLFSMNEPPRYSYAAAKPPLVALGTAQADASSSSSIFFQSTTAEEGEGGSEGSRHGGPRDAPQNLSSPAEVIAAAIEGAGEDEGPSLGGTSAAKRRGAQTAGDAQRHGSPGEAGEGLRAASKTASYPGASAASIFGSGSLDGACKLWDARQPKSICTFQHGSPVVDVRFCEYEGLLLFSSASVDSHVLLWDLRLPGAPVRSFHGLSQRVDWAAAGAGGCCGGSGGGNSNNAQAGKPGGARRGDASRRGSGDLLGGGEGVMTSRTTKSAFHDEYEISVL